MEMDVQAEEPVGDSEPEPMELDDSPEVLLRDRGGLSLEEAVLGILEVQSPRLVGSTYFSRRAARSLDSWKGYFRKISSMRSSCLELCCL